MNISPDGWQYLEMGAGRLAPKPYNRRWLLPRLLGANHEQWQWMTWMSLGYMPFAACFYVHAMGLSALSACFAMALICAQPGLRLSLVYPILIDAPSFALTLIVAALAHSGYPLLAALLSLPLGAMRETGPVFAALWSWSPWPLIGLAAVGWWKKSAPTNIEWLVHPVRTAWDKRKQLGLDGAVYVVPFGAALAGLGAPSWQMLATVIAAHAQLFIAQDTLRLAVWCAPVLCIAAAKVIPQTWWILAVIVTVMHRPKEV